MLGRERGEINSDFDYSKKVCNIQGSQEKNNFNSLMWRLVSLEIKISK